jgi:hypothetical protein
VLDPVCHTLEGHVRLLTLPSADGARMRNELDKVRTMLEESFTRSHQQALLNGSIGEAGSISETLVGSSKSPKPGESVTEYDKPSELTIYSTPSRITLKKPKALPTLSTVLDSDISIFAPVSPSLSLQLDVRELLTGGPNGTKDDPTSEKILQLIHRLAVSEAASPQQFSCIANAASDLARAYRERGQLFLASVYFQQALASREAELGPDHPGTLSAMYNLALVYADQKKYSEAMEYFEVVHTKRSQTLSDLHPSVLAVDLKIASVHKSQGQIEQALQIYNDVLHKYQAVLGENHPSTLAVICDIAGTYREQGRLEEAMASYQDILKCCDTGSGIAQRRIEEAKTKIEDIKRELAKGDDQGESVEAYTASAITFLP